MEMSRTKVFFLDLFKISTSILLAILIFAGGMSTWESFKESSNDKQAAETKAKQEAEKQAAQKKTDEPKVQSWGSADFVPLNVKFSVVVTDIRNRMHARVSMDGDRASLERVLKLPQDERFFLVYVDRDGLDTYRQWLQRRDFRRIANASGELTSLEHQFHTNWAREEFFRSRITSWRIEWPDRGEASTKIPKGI